MEIEFKQNQAKDQRARKTDLYHTQDIQKEAISILRQPLQ